VTERILGESGSPRRRRFLLLPVLLTAALALFWIAGASAVHDVGLFELDQNAVANDGPGDDWSLLDDGVGDPNNDDSAVASVFVTDGIEGDDPSTGAVETSDDDVYATNSKDIQDISAWKWKAQFPEDKNDIEHAYAAAYFGADGSDPGTEDDLYLYFGIDRMANNGSASLGMWFLQDEVSQDGDGQGNDPFLGNHTAGDILVQTDFTTGGTIERIDIYMWDADGFGYTGAKTLVAGDLWRIFEGQDCDTSPSGDPACGQVNTAPVTAPWAYSYKCVGSNQPPGAPPVGCDGVSGVNALNNFPKATFFEGGVNLSAFGLTDVCLATIVANSRSSASETSTLDDKALGGFNLCGALRILKNSTKGGAVANAGAEFEIDPDPTGGVGVLTIVDNGANDEDPDVGELCISSIPPATYSVEETVAPAGYGPTTSTNPQSAAASAGSSCSSGAVSFTFADPPLADIQVRFKDGGSGETVLDAAGITCNNATGSSSTADTTGWDDTLTVTGVNVTSATITVTCTIPIDP